MKKNIEEHIKKVKNGDVALKEHKDKILFYQHERLIHLIVTMSVGLFTLMALFVLLIVNNIFVFALFIILLILLTLYLMHYYYLENKVQYLYILYDELSKEGK